MNMTAAFNLDENLAKRESLLSQYAAGEITLDAWLAADDLLAAESYADTEAKMAPLLASWTEAHKELRKQRFFNQTKVTRTLDDSSRFHRQRSTKASSNY